MSIFSAPSFYGAADRAIYDAGNYFIPQEQYRGAFNMTSPATGTGAAAATGINTVLNQGGGGGGGSNPFNPDMNQIRTDFRPDTEFRQFQDFGNLTDDQLSTADRKEMDMNPEYYGINTGVPRTGIAGFFDKAMGFLPGVGFLSRIAPFIQSKLPVNERAILENQARGKGILTDDIGRIVAGDGIYNTPEGVMAGYNLNKITDKTFDKRTDRISKTLGDKYGISAADIQGLIDGTLDDDDISAKYGITTNLTSQIRNVQLARQNILGAKKKAADIAAFKEAQRKAKAAEKERQKAFKDARNARDSDNDGVPDYVEDAGGTAPGGGYATDYYGGDGGGSTPSGGGGNPYGGGPGGVQSGMGGGSPGSSGPGGSDEMGSFAYGGRVRYMMGGLADLVDIYD